ncbi:membrane protein [Desulfotomaculum defluvii]
MKKLIFHLLQLSWLMLGLFNFGLAITFLVEARLGVSPWDVLHLGLTNYLPFTFGQVMIGAGIICVIVSYPLGVKPRLATILNMIFIGVFTDIIMAAGWVPHQETYLMRCLYLLAGIIGCGLGTGIYITANMGTGPRDSLMMGIYKVTGWRISVVRTILEISVVIIGFFLGGPVGAGTLAFCLTIGWTTEVFLNFFTLCGKQEWFTSRIDLLRTNNV